MEKKSKDSIEGELKKLQEEQTIIQKEFVELKKAKADTTVILQRLQEGKAKIAATVRLISQIFYSNFD